MVRISGKDRNSPNFTCMGLCLLCLSTYRTTSNLHLSSSRANIRVLTNILRYKMCVWSRYPGIQYVCSGNKYQNPLACCLGPLVLQIMDLVTFGSDCPWNKHYNTSTRQKRRVGANPGAPLGLRGNKKRKRSQEPHKHPPSTASSPALSTPTSGNRTRPRKRK